MGSYFQSVVGWHLGRDRMAESTAEEKLLMPWCPGSREQRDKPWRMTPVENDSSPPASVCYLQASCVTPII